VTFVGHDRLLLSRTVSVELHQNEVSVSVHTLCAVLYRELSQQPFLTPAAGDQPLAYKIPFVTNHHIVIKDRLMLIFCVYRPTAIKRQQHSVNILCCFDVIGDATLNTPLRELPSQMNAQLIY